MPEPLPSLPPRSADVLYNLAGVQLTNWENFERSGATGAETADAASERLENLLELASEMRDFIAAKPADVWQERALRCLLIIIEAKCDDLRKLL